MFIYFLIPLAFWIYTTKINKNFWPGLEKKLVDYINTEPTYNQIFKYSGVNEDVITKNYYLINRNIANAKVEQLIIGVNTPEARF